MQMQSVQVLNYHKKPPFNVSKLIIIHPLIKLKNAILKLLIPLQ